MALPQRPWRRASARAAASLVLWLPTLGVALEPRFDHRDQRGPTAETLIFKDILWRGSASATSALRGAVRVAWTFDPSGDGDEVQLGGTLTAFEGNSTGEDRVRWTLEARYRVLGGTEELKTLFDVGIWASAADRVAVGPLVGVGAVFDFTRNIGVLASGFLGAGFGQGRVVSFGGGVGVQYRFE